MTENKLTLEVLSAYLPYGLKLQGIKKETFGIQDKVYELFKLSNALNGNMIVSGRVRSDLGGTFSVGDYEVRKDSDQLFKPILRPVFNDGLSRPLEIDGEQIYFSTWIAKETGIQIDWQLDFEIESPHSYEETLYLPLMDTIKVYNLMVKYHFDVFGLIEKGLAIDINTIKK